MQGVWLPLIEYVRVTNSSISTVRRHIKKNKVNYRYDNGRYLIFCDSKKYQEHILEKEKTDLTVQLENIRLKNEVNELKEEVQELRMLLNVYEEKLTPPEPPQLPL